MTYEKYPAKVLLFGEHVLLRGASALSVPVTRFGGHWAWLGKRRSPALQGRLPELARSEALSGIPGLDAEAFSAELERGIWFRSDIPSGYGLGSSGVLCAAIYDRYCSEKTDDPATLKAIFSKMESFFHGNSSGIDPLTSYLRKPVLVRNRSEVSTPEMPDWRKNLKIFLLDTRQTRQTGALVHRFARQCESPDFARYLDGFLARHHEPMLDSFLKNESDEFWEHLAQTSDFQWENMRFLIPESIFFRWEEGLRRGDYYLKICGAGGGGFMLLFVRKTETAEFLGRLHRLTEL